VAPSRTHAESKTELNVFIRWLERRDPFQELLAKQAGDPHSLAPERIALLRTIRWSGEAAEAQAVRARRAADVRACRLRQSDVSWSTDFVADALADGRKLRRLNIVDN
jgi:hypothetical protein